ncbi:MAG: class I SAM-dependent methyltransferase, partial [Rhodospirillaceae bacterium]|nr:class I SAM-dependent methyltransferase [Rhodospirillaceae bacterium]
ATVIGVEPDPVQAEKNRVAQAVPGCTFIQSGGETLPMADSSQDAVFFFYSMHHVPLDLMATVIGEAARVLRPEGFLYSLEPLMTGSSFALQRFYNDETEMRTAAQKALHDTGDGLFTEAARYTSMRSTRHQDFEALLAQVTGVSYNRIAREKVDKPEVRAIFEAGKTDAGDYAFDQPMLVTLLRGPKAG